MLLLGMLMVQSGLTELRSDSKTSPILELDRLELISLIELIKFFN